MQFTTLVEKMQKNLDTMLANTTKLFQVNIDKEIFWNLYLDSFPEGTNKIFRERREYDCNCCKNFIRSFGNVVKINDDYTIQTIWGFNVEDTTFQPVLNALNNYIKKALIENAYLPQQRKIGVAHNFEAVEDGQPIKWNHFAVTLPSTLSIVSTNNDTIGSMYSDFASTKNVFLRSLQEITLDSLNIVLELINQKSLYKGEEWTHTLTTFKKLKQEFSKLNIAQQTLFAWKHSANIDKSISKLRNHSMGTLLVNISENMPLDTAVQKYEKIVAPENYKRPKPVYTQKMLQNFEKTITDLGYLDSLARRFARIEDITINNILFANKDSAKNMRSAPNNIFAQMQKDCTTNPQNFDKVEETTIENFIENILPTTTELELYLENKHAQNFVSLTAPVIEDSKSMFKWNNSFAYSYSGNLADSSIKQNVKSAGGNVDGFMRFSLQWNDSNVHERSDLDAHCIEPNGYEIYFGNKRHPSPTNGILDIDIIHPKKNIPAVENIYWTSPNKLAHGEYEFFVHVYSLNSTNARGFSAELEINNEIHQFEYRDALRRGQKIKVASVLHTENGFMVKNHLPSSVSSKQVWNLTTNNFIPVSVMMHSPNYWDSQKGIGHKHYFFMLKDCINSESPNAFYNEFLKEELLKHKREFEAIAGKLPIQDDENQLSGLGFSSTKRNEVILRTIGATKRLLKIKF